MTDIKLRRAFTIYGNMLADSLLNEKQAEQHEFSPEFERKMQELIASLEKKPAVYRQ